MKVSIESPGHLQALYLLNDMYQIPIETLVTGLLEMGLCFSYCLAGSNVTQDIADCREKWWELSPDMIELFDILVKVNKQARQHGITVNKIHRVQKGDSIHTEHEPIKVTAGSYSNALGHRTVYDIAGEGRRHHKLPRPTTGLPVNMIDGRKNYSVPYLTPAQSRTGSFEYGDFKIRGTNMTANQIVLHWYREFFNLELNVESLK